MQLLLEGFVTHESPHYCFHVRPGSLAERELGAIIRTQEAVYARVTAVLGAAPAYLLHYVFANSPEEVGQLYGDGIPCHACAIEPDVILCTYNECDRCIGAHEDTHLIACCIASRKMGCCLRALRSLWKEHGMGCLTRCRLVD